MAIATVTSCSKNDDIASGSYNRGDLIETVKKGSLIKAEITERITELDASGFALYDATYERVIYRPQ